jgi:hypothetical protein
MHKRIRRVALALTAAAVVAIGEASPTPLPTSAAAG